MNGINLVQVPLQGTGIGQPVSCIGASRRANAWVRPASIRHGVPNWRRTA